MKHHIDPIVDCVFKVLLDSEQNKNLLTKAINGVLPSFPNGGYYENA